MFNNNPCGEIFLLGGVCKLNNIGSGFYGITKQMIRKFKIEKILKYG